MALKTENFFKSQLRVSKISIFLATTFSFLLMFIIGLVIINSHALQTNLKENVVMNVVLVNSLKEKETQQLIKSLSIMSHIKSVKFISKEVAAEELKSQLGENFLELLDANPLSDIIEIKYVAEFVSASSLLNERDNLNKYYQIDEVFYDRNLLSLIDTSFNKLATFILLFSCLIIFISFNLIHSNIRLTIYSKRFLLKTMQLVGATKSFIQKPFLTSNLLSSLFASTFGIFLLSAIYFVAKDRLPSIQQFMSFNEILYLLIVVSLVNILISFLCTWFCVRNYLNLSTEDLYK
ncbi:MAG: hypothetical protein CMP65_01670 [Flavobacteriales bacterium]|nr:hypothetical protein [Flavobacteriales bacterium]